MANLIRKTCNTKPYRNRPRFVKDMTKHFGVFRFTVVREEVQEEEKIQNKKNKKNLFIMSGLPVL